jgi:hypothetical protein
MPVILDTHRLAGWFGGTAGTELLKPALATLRMWPVSRRVNWPGNEGDTKLIEAIH